MENTKPKPPKWTVLCILVGALCALIAAVFAFSRNAESALIFGLMALVLYVTAFIGLALHKKSIKNI
jgi:peptidoglycan/LPS O-acetylase OafA/YrhL